MSAREGGMGPLIEVELEDAAWAAALPTAEALTVETALAALTCAPDGGLACGSVTILLTDDATVRDLNARFRDKDYATNVLSFPAAPLPGFSGPQPLGDLALAYGVCAAEAATQGKTLANHLRHLVAHGVLHLLGHDHADDDEAEAMETLERKILAGLGVADPYRAGMTSGAGAGHV